MPVRAGASGGGNRWQFDVLVTLEGGSESGAVLTGCKGLHAPLLAYHTLETNSTAVKWTRGNAVEFKTRVITSAVQTRGHFPPMKVNLIGIPGKERTQKLSGAARDWCIKNPGYGSSSVVLVLD